MAERLEIYKCDLCGNIVEVLFGKQGQLYCCGKPMNLLKENDTDASTEKHVPVIEKTDEGILVKVGSVDHPMEEKHYIQWIEIIDGEEIHIAFLKPTDKPQALFKIQPKGKIRVREYCNIHGLWVANG